MSMEELLRQLERKLQNEDLTQGSRILTTAIVGYLQELQEYRRKKPCYRLGGMMVEQCEICESCPDKPDYSGLAWNGEDDE